MAKLLILFILLFLYYITIFAVSYSYYKDVKLVNGCILYIRVPDWVGDDKEITWPVCAISLLTFLSFLTYFTKFARFNLIQIKKKKQWIISAVADNNQKEEDTVWSYGLLGAKYNNPDDPAIFKSYNSKGPSDTITVNHKLFIECKTANGIIIINDDEEDKTKEIYETLNNLLKER